LSPAAFAVHSFTLPAMSKLPKGFIPRCAPTGSGVLLPKLLNWSRSRSSGQVVEFRDGLLPANDLSALDEWVLPILRLPVGAGIQELLEQNAGSASGAAVDVAAVAPVSRRIRERAGLAIRREP